MSFKKCPLLSLHVCIVVTFSLNYEKGSARTLNPTIKNYALEPPLFGAVAGVSPSRCAMDRPRPGGTTLVIMVSSVPGKYDLRQQMSFHYAFLINGPFLSTYQSSMLWNLPAIFIDSFWQVALHVCVKINIPYKESSLINVLHILLIIWNVEMRLLTNITHGIVKRYEKKKESNCIVTRWIAAACSSIWLVWWMR
jgi:hypothetical protein